MVDVFKFPMEGKDIPMSLLPLSRIAPRTLSVANNELQYTETK